jgi:REP element-mobilizing transposase RayT
VKVIMGSTFYSLHYHIVFSTKERQPFLRPEWRARAHEYLGGTVRGLGGVAESVGGVEDHVHLLVSLKTTQAPADLTREVKKASLCQPFGLLRIRGCFNWACSGPSHFTHHISRFAPPFPDLTRARFCRNLSLWQTRLGTSSASPPLGNPTAAESAWL